MVLSALRPPARLPGDVTEPEPDTLPSEGHATRLLRHYPAVMWSVAYGCWLFIIIHFIRIATHAMYKDIPHTAGSSTS